MFAILQVSSGNIRHFLSLGLEQFVSWNIRNFFRAGFCFFLELGKFHPNIFLFLALGRTISRNLRVLFSRNIRKVCLFVLRKCKKLFQSGLFFLFFYLFMFLFFSLSFELGLKSYISQIIKNGFWWGNIIHFQILVLESFISQNKRKFFFEKI